VGRGGDFPDPDCFLVGRLPIRVVLKPVPWGLRSAAEL
jgi:hypothetical protein